MATEILPFLSEVNSSRYLQIGIQSNDDAVALYSIAVPLLMTRVTIQYRFIAEKHTRAESSENACNTQNSVTQNILILCKHRPTLARKGYFTSYSLSLLPIRKLSRCEQHTKTNTVHKPNITNCCRSSLSMCEGASNTF